LNFFGRVASAADRFGDRPAIELVRAGALDTTTYGALVGEAAQFAAWLAAAGITRGDRVAILADNDARWVACYLGAIRMGAVGVPLDTAYKPPQVRAILDNSGARVLFTTPRYLDSARAAVAAPGARGPQLVLLTGRAPGLAGPDEVGWASPVPPAADVEPDDAAVILYTSGTTADPKGVVLTHANLDAERQAALAIVDVSEHDVVLGVLPLFHALAQMANLLLPLSAGARVVFLESVNSATLLEALQTRGVTIFACVPQFFYLIHQRVQAEVARAGALRRLLFRTLVAANASVRDAAGWNPGRRIFSRVHRVLGSRMRFLVTGGSRFDPVIGRGLYGLGFTVLNAYGLTETSGGATIVRPGDRFTSSVGQPFPGVEVRIADSRTATPELRSSNIDVRTSDLAGSSQQSDGEICIRGPIVMREYFNRPDATAEAVQNGWLQTGDLGRLDAQGRLYITGRKKEIIVLSSGKNLYPEEIEGHYGQSPFIKELCVLGLTPPGQPAAERLHAVIVPDDARLRERGIVNVRELIRFELEGLAVQLPAHKRILSYDIWLDPLPRTTTGKPRRHEIERRVRERAAAPPADERPLTDEERAWLAEPGRQALVSAIASHLDRPVGPHSNLELDLNLDSMERVELLTLLEHRRGTRVAAGARAAIFTVRQLVDAVVAAEPAAGTPTAAGADVETATVWRAVLSEPPAPELLQNLAARKTLVAAAGFVLVGVLGLMARLLLRYRVRGVEHLPRTGPFLLSPNHQTYVDGFFLGAALPFRILRRLFFVGAAEYFETPFTAWFARTLNIVPVDPDASLVSAMQAGAAGLRLGRVLVLFPEGERSIDGELKTFRKGAAILASELGVPIVPVALDGLYDLWPRGRSFQWALLLPWHGRPVTLAFGAPLSVARDDVVAGTAELRQAVGKLLSEIRSTTNFELQT
jgi:long-chain acyl-CoA synthetase